MSCRAALDYLVDLSMRPESMHITLLHVFRKASASEELMGKTFTREEEARLSSLQQEAKGKLIERGFVSDQIRTIMVEEPYPTIADGLIDQFKREKFDLVLIGRKRMSKAEEFVMGDVSIKLVRALENAAVLVVTSP